MSHGRRPCVVLPILLLCWEAAAHERASTPHTWWRFYEGERFHEDERFRDTIYFRASLPYLRCYIYVFTAAPCACPWPVLCSESPSSKPEISGDVRISGSGSSPYSILIPPRRGGRSTETTRRAFFSSGPAALGPSGPAPASRVPPVRRVWVCSVVPSVGRRRRAARTAPLTPRRAPRVSRAGISPDYRRHLRGLR